METVDMIFYGVVLLLGAFFYAGGTMVNNSLQNDNVVCATGDLIKYNQGIIIVSTILFVTILAFLSCSFLCDCNYTFMSRNNLVYQIILFIISLILMILSIQLNGSISDSVKDNPDCSTILTWSSAMMGISITIFSLILLRFAFRPITNLVERIQSRRNRTEIYE